MVAFRQSYRGIMWLVLCAVGLSVAGCARSQGEIDGHYYTAHMASDGTGKYDVTKTYKQAEIGVVSSGSEIIDQIKENANTRSRIVLSDGSRIELSVTRVTPNGQSTESSSYGMSASSLATYNDQLGLHLLIPDGLQEPNGINYALTADSEFEMVSITSVAEFWNDETVTMDIYLFPNACTLQSGGITAGQPTYQEFTSDQQLKADVILDEDRSCSYITVVCDNILYEYRLSSADEVDVCTFLNDLR